MEGRRFAPHERGQTGRSPLQTAAYNGQLRQVVDLLQRGAQLDAQSRLPSDKGRQALHLAALGGHRDVVHELLKRGANPDAADHQGFRPLHIAAQHGAVDIVQHLLHANVNLKTQTKAGWQAVHLAAGGGHVAVLKLLQDYHCNLAVPDISSATPLHHAASRGQKDAVRWLIKAGVPFNVKDKEGMSAADRATQNGHHDIYVEVAAAAKRGATRHRAGKRYRSQPNLLHGFQKPTVEIPRPKTSDIPQESPSSPHFYRFSFHNHVQMPHTTAATTVISSTTPPQDPMSLGRQPSKPPQALPAREAKNLPPKSPPPHRPPPLRQPPKSPPPPRLPPKSPKRQRQAPESPPVQRQPPKSPPPQRLPPKSPKRQRQPPEFPPVQRQPPKSPPPPRLPPKSPKGQRQPPESPSLQRQPPKSPPPPRLPPKSPKRQRQPPESPPLQRHPPESTLPQQKPPDSPPRQRQPPESPPPPHLPPKSPKPQRQPPESPPLQRQPPESPPLQRQPPESPPLQRQPSESPPSQHSPSESPPPERQRPKSPSTERAPSQGTQASQSPDVLPSHDEQTPASPKESAEVISLGPCEPQDTSLPSSPGPVDFPPSPPVTSSAQSSSPSIHSTSTVTSSSIHSTSTVTSLSIHSTNTVTSVSSTPSLSLTDPSPSPTACPSNSPLLPKEEGKPVKKGDKKATPLGIIKQFMRQWSSKTKITKPESNVNSKDFKEEIAEDGGNLGHGKHGSRLTSEAPTQARDGCGLGTAERNNPGEPPQQEAAFLDLVVEEAPRPFREGPDVYPCITNPRGLVIILNNKSFHDRPDLTRYGSECDTKNLEDVFHKMGHDVRTRSDLTRQDTLDWFREVSRLTTLQSVSCLFVFILSHGEGRNVFCTYDNLTVKLDEVQSCFLNQSCPGLKGKPKVFFSHFCRGKDEETQSQYSSDTTREAYKDMLCLYSSTEGFQALRHPRLGTPSVRALCRTLARHSHSKHFRDIVQEFQKLYETMEGATSPEVQDFKFKKDFYLNPTGKSRLY